MGSYTVEIHSHGGQKVIYQDDDHQLSMYYDNVRGLGRTIAIWIGLAECWTWTWLRSSRLTQDEKSRVKEVVESELGRRGTRVVWVELPQPEEAPPPAAGTLGYESYPHGIELSTSLTDFQQLRHLWALLARELARHWGLDTLVVRERKLGPALRVPIEVSGWTRDPGWFEWDGRLARRSLTLGIARPSPENLYPMVACWAPLTDLVMGFRADTPVGEDWLPRLDAAARAGRLPAGDRGFLIHSEQRAMRVFVSSAEAEATLGKLAEWGKMRGLRMEERRGAN